MSNEPHVGIRNGGFEAGWDDLPPAPGNLINQQPKGWRLSWLNPGDTLWDSGDKAQGVPECVHKHVDQLPLHEHPGQPEALILDGQWVYKIFHAGAPFGAELRQTVAGLKPGTQTTVRAPVLIDGHGDFDIFGAEAGLWVNGQGEWRNLERHGHRKWHTHTQTVTVPDDGVVEVMLRFKSKWPAPKDFFIDAVQMEATPAPITDDTGEVTGEELSESERLRLGLMSWPGYPVVPPEDGGGETHEGVETGAVEAGLLVNGSFEAGWDDLPPAPGNLVNQQPKGWRLIWLEPGQRLWDSNDAAQGVPECVHKHADQLPPHEQPGGSEALILDGVWVYKVFHGGAPFGAELRQTVAGLKPGTQATVRAPVLIDAHGDGDPFGAEAGLWVNGQGGWVNLGQHGSRKWHTHTQTVAVPETGAVEVVLRVKSKWASAKDFFIDDLRLQAVPGVVPPPEAPFLTPTERELKVREGPGLQFTIRTMVNPGDKMVVLEPWETASVKLGKQGQWINVRAPDGVEGWSAAWFLTLYTEPPPGLYPAPMNEYQLWQKFGGPNGHWGIDLGAAEGEPVFCGPAGGFVIRAFKCSKCTDDRPSVLHHDLPLNDPGVLGSQEWGWGYGHHVIVRYLNDILPEATRQALADKGLAGAHLFCMYAHLDAISEGAEGGRMLTPGAQIGTCGETGNAEGVHLHLEMRAGSDPNMSAGWAPLFPNLLDPNILFSR